MSHTPHVLAVGLAIIATGLVAGVILAFSDFVMKSLALIPPEAGSEAMQVINRKVYGSIFIALLIGMSVYSVLLGGYAFLRLEGSAATWIIAGSTIYLIGTFLVTVVFNVPMNQKLDVMDHTALSTANYWATYLKNWTFWNHVRTMAPTAAMVCFLVSFYHLARETGAAAVGS